MIEYGFWALFAASFLAATVVPFSSEVILSGMLLAGYDPITSLVVASLGNWLGGMSSYGLGRLGKMAWIHKYLRMSSAKIEKTSKFVEGRAAWISIFCWLPFVGDILAVVLGLLRANVFITAIGMLVGKVLRYAIWGWITLTAMGIW